MRETSGRSIAMGRSDEPFRRAALSLALWGLGMLGLPVSPVAPPAWAQAPGPELFAKEPETPAELWDAIDYLIRTGQPSQAVPYLEKFSKSEVDDATLVDLRDRYGSGSFLRLADNPATKPYAEPLTKKLADASLRRAADPERIRSYIPGLTQSSREQDYAVSRLRESGPYAVPPLVEAIAAEPVASPNRSLLVRNAGRLDQASVPAWIAVLDSSDPNLAADAATILGSIGDRRAVPFLTYPAAAADSPLNLKTAADQAIARLTGRPVAEQSRTPARVLIDAANAYARHQVDLPGETVLVWVWDEAKRAPVPVQADASDVDAIFGLKLARQALSLDPNSRIAKAALVGLSLQKAIDRVGFTNFPAQDQQTFAAALAAGPEVLTDVLRAAIADGRTDLAAVAATALGKTTDPKLLAGDGRPHPLVEALSLPGRRLQFAAAKALVDLAPTEPFPGSSRVVPTLARFVVNQGPPRAIVIDGNPTRGAIATGLLKELGYESSLETAGDKGFLAATESADVELILISHDLPRTPWSLTDVLTNLRGDARTANLPLYVYGPSSLDYTRPELLRNFPGVKYLIYGDDRALFERQLGEAKSKLTDEERSARAKEAAELLARIASRPGGLFAADLANIEPALASALGTPGVDVSVSTALSDVPNPSAQRSLADAVLDGSRDDAFRRQTAEKLARSIQRFGPMLSPDQEVKVAGAFRSEDDPELKAALGAVVGVLRRDLRPGVKQTGPEALPAPATTPTED